LSGECGSIDPDVGSHPMLESVLVLTSVLGSTVVEVRPLAMPLTL
jgi:hypothetical protein